MYTFVYLDQGRWYAATKGGQAIWCRSTDHAMREAEAHWRQERRGEYAIATQDEDLIWYGRPGVGWCTDRTFPSAQMENLFPRNAQWQRWGG